MKFITIVTLTAASALVRNSAVASDSFTQQDPESGRTLLVEFFGGNVEDNLVLEERTALASTSSQCSLRSCHQYVVGRNLPYARALQIIQNQEFLDAVAFERVGLKRTNFQRRKSGGGGSVNRRRQPQQQAPLRQRPVKRRRGRWKRQLLSSTANLASNLGVNAASANLNLINGAEGLKIGGVAAAAGAAAAAGGGAVAAASAAFIALSGAAVGVPGASAGAEGVLPAVGQPLPSANGAIPPGAGPIPPGVGPGGVPIGQPIPGSTTGGGILPLGNSPVVKEALALLEPLGLASGLVIPVAVFPQQQSGSRSVSIIFLELSAAPVRKSLSLWASKEKTLTFRTRRLGGAGGVGGQRLQSNAFQDMRDAMKRRLQKLAFDIKCFLPRLKHNLMQHELQNNSRLKKKLNKVAAPIIQKRRSSILNAKKGRRPMKVTKAQIFAKNCFPEPLYGFRTKVTLIDNQPCVSGKDCDERQRRHLADNEDVTAATSYFPSNYPPTLSGLFARRQGTAANAAGAAVNAAGGEFTPEGPPQWNIANDPTNRCLHVPTNNPY